MAYDVILPKYSENIVEVITHGGYEGCHGVFTPDDTSLSHALHIAHSVDTIHNDTCRIAVVNISDQEKTIKAGELVGTIDVLQDDVHFTPETGDPKMAQDDLDIK